MKVSAVLAGAAFMTAVLISPLTNPVKLTLGEHLYQAGYDSAALQVYRTLAWSGDVLGKNNYAALLYRQAQVTEKETAAYRYELQSYVSEAFARLGDTNPIGSFNQLMQVPKTHLPTVTRSEVF
jgi:hypothetical protein